MIIFKNKGEIDLRAVRVMGISSKEKVGAIGYFGTGLKYAIAVLLRENIPFGMKTGGKVYEFSKATETVRVDQFDFCYINGEQLPFTTEFGKNWKPWQAFRELYCNCTDEDGEIFQAETLGELIESVNDYDGTVIWVDHPEFDKIYKTRGEIILDPGRQPLEILDDVEIHAGASKFLYYKGIKAYEMGAPTIYTYNITSNLTLTEDRTISDYFGARSVISRAVMASENDDIIRSCLGETRNDFIEKEFDYDWSAIVPGDTFCEVVERMTARRQDINLSAFRRVQKFKRITNDPKIIEPDEIQRKAINRAVEFCKLLGYEVDEYPIVVSDFLGRRMVGGAKGETIWISVEAFKHGTKYLASTLIEEFLHLSQGFDDCSREMQNYLFDTLVDFGERYILKDVL